MAEVLKVRDFRRRKCDKCGLKISGKREDMGRTYVRASKSRTWNRYGSPIFTGRDTWPRARYICQTCWVDAKGRPLLDA